MARSKKFWRVDSIWEEAGIFCFILFVLGLYGSFALGLEELVLPADKSEVFVSVIFLILMVAVASLLSGYVGVLIDSWIRPYANLPGLRWLVTIPEAVKRRL